MRALAFVKAAAARRFRGTRHTDNTAAHGLQEQETLSSLGQDDGVKNRTSDTK